ncbi:hypothetical protein C3D67_18590 [Cronobacter sakazakii]|uniref:hypothetical protein n=1 Tax=Enterobacteriaceae TaxID=543 RepID=UPI000CF0A496|nr:MULTISPECIES: hypothetical protein [Enterobacteriaceae]MBW9402518.1 hypothetical protein [Leclercia sp. EC_58]MDH0064520.1 hypothetical protein [Leclercia adecarboxylata]PPY04525.1 hypothetical protein C3D67_18590 [Cronobacter sakazakii]
MSLVKRTAEQLITRILRARAIPEQQWPELIKKTGRGMILLGVLMVVPLLLIEKVALPVTIAMQICYASLICVGVLLAFDEKKSKGRS